MVVIRKRDQYSSENPLFFTNYRIVAPLEFEIIHYGVAVLYLRSFYPSIYSPLYNNYVDDNDVIGVNSQAMYEYVIVQVRAFCIVKN